MAPLCCAAKFEPFLFLGLRPHALHPGGIQGKEGIKFCHLATPITAAINQQLEAFPSDSDNLLREQADQGCLRSTVPAKFEYVQRKRDFLRLRDTASEHNQGKVLIRCCVCGWDGINMNGVITLY